MTGHRGPVGQYSPVDSEVGGSNLGDGKSSFFWTAKMKWKWNQNQQAIHNNTFILVSFEGPCNKHIPNIYQ